MVRGKEVWDDCQIPGEQLHGPWSHFLTGKDWRGHQLGEDQEFHLEPAHRCL